MENKNIFLKTPNIKINKYLTQKKKPYKVVNLFIDNLKKEKIYNDDAKLFLYTHRLLNQFKLGIKDIKRIKSSSYKNKYRIDKTLFNCYNFFNKKTQTITKSNNIDYKNELNNGNESDKENMKYSLNQNNKTIKHKILGRYSFSSEKRLSNIIQVNKFSKIPENKDMCYLPNFKTFSNILASKINNQYSFFFPSQTNNFNLIEKDFLNITKINYLNTFTQKRNNNLISQNTSPNKTNENTRLDTIKKEKNVKIIPMKEKLKLFSFVNNKKHNIVYDNPPLNFYDKDNYFYYNIYPENCGWLIKECLKHRTKWKECHSLNTNLYNFKWKEVGLVSDFLDYNNNIDINQMINHYEYNSCITNKYNLFLNLITYCENKNIEVFKYIPFTIILDDSNYDEFSEYLVNFKYIFSNINKYIFENKLIKEQTFDRKKINYKTYFSLKNTKLGIKTHIVIPSTHYAGKNLWIIKAPNLNRGRCIKVFNNYDKIIQFINEITRGKVYEYDNITEEKDNKENNDKGYKYKSNRIIIQKYIEKPFLYNGRKFDIRIWVLLTHKMNAYIFKEGHLKVSSINYDLDSNNSFIHLTNYSLQKFNKHFSKYEKGNEVSFETFQKYINEIMKKDINFKNIVYPQFIEIIKHTIKCTKNLINISDRQNCFELMGYDFLIDEDFNVFLIEINSNPGLEISSEIIKMLVPRMIDDALRLTVDNVFKSDYDKEWKNEKGEYCSKYHVKGYKDEDNLWEFVCDANDKKIDDNYYNNSDSKKKTKIKKYKLNKHYNKRKKSKRNDKK